MELDQRALHLTHWSSNPSAHCDALVDSSAEDQESLESNQAWGSCSMVQNYAQHWAKEVQVPDSAENVAAMSPSHRSDTHS